MAGQALSPRRRIDRRQQRGQRTRLAFPLELHRLRHAQVQFNGAPDPCPVLDLAGDRALPRLAGNASVQDDLVRQLDWLAHDQRVAFCYLSCNLERPDQELPPSADIRMTSTSWTIHQRPRWRGLRSSSIPKIPSSESVSRTSFAEGARRSVPFAISSSTATLRSVKNSSGFWSSRAPT